MSKNLISERQALDIFSISQRIEMGLSEKKNVIAASEIAERDFNTPHLSFSARVQDRETALALIKIHLNQKIANLLLYPHKHDGFSAGEPSESYGMAYVRFTIFSDLEYTLRAYLNEDDAEAYVKSCFNDCLPIYKDLLDAGNSLLKLEANAPKGDINRKAYCYTLTLLVNAPAYHASERKQYMF